MPQKKNWLIVSFASTTEALRAEKIFRQAEIGGQLIPTPRSVNASCGLCWRTIPEDHPLIEEQLAVHGIKTEALLEMLM